MLTELIGAVRRHTDAGAGTASQPPLGAAASVFRTAVDGLTLFRSADTTFPVHTIYRPALCLVVQGGKQVTLGRRTFRYRAGQALVVSVELPTVAAVEMASPGAPYLAVAIELDLPILRDVFEALDPPPKPSGAATLGLFVGEVSGAIADCALRLVRLLDTPAAIPVLHPAIMRELCYWLLTGPHAAEIAKIALPHSHTRRLTQAIHLLRRRFTETVRIETLARAANMSASAFHRQFKALTSMTPLQYQKRLRLLEARRLMLAEAANVETAAYRVGYESASQFSREYARMFGTPPKRDVATLKSAAA